MKGFKGFFAQETNWFSRFICTHCGGLIARIIFKLPYSKFGWKTLGWLALNTPVDEYEDK